MLTCTNPIRRIEPYILYFMLYAVFGWCYEVFLEVVIYHWGFTNRGVLFGPYCPIYGVGAMLFLLCFSRLMQLRGSTIFRLCKPMLIFLGTMAVATAVELAATYLLEWTIGSWPWQTYADYAYNFQARIALSPSVRFGIGGVLFLYVMQPMFAWLVGKLGPKTMHIVVFTVLMVVCIDITATVLAHIL
ncbi:MAG: putative ABC transporter permease [Eubacteriales bacterium]|nr:putative ABC transporter permease [Eubacteriales bacterium]